MKRTFIFGGITALLWACAGQTASAQCSAQGSNSAYCAIWGDGNNYQATYWITPGIPVNISDEFEGSGNVEADMGCCTIWFDSSSDPIGGTQFTAAENTDGYLYLAVGAAEGSYAEIGASW